MRLEPKIVMREFLENEARGSWSPGKNYCLAFLAVGRNGPQFLFFIAAICYFYVMSTCGRDITQLLNVDEAQG